MNPGDNVIDAEFEDVPPADDHHPRNGKKHPFMRTLDSVITAGETFEKPLRHVHVETADQVKKHVETFKALRSDVEEAVETVEDVKSNVTEAIDAGKKMLTKASDAFKKVNEFRGSARMHRGNPFKRR